MRGFTWAHFGTLGGRTERRAIFMAEMQHIGGILKNEHSPYTLLHGMQQKSLSLLFTSIEIRIIMARSSYLCTLCTWVYVWYWLHVGFVCTLLKAWNGWSARSFASVAIMKVVSMGWVMDSLEPLYFRCQKTKKQQCQNRKNCRQQSVRRHGGGKIATLLQLKWTFFYVT